MAANQDQTQSIEFKFWNESTIYNCQHLYKVTKWKHPVLSSHCVHSLFKGFSWKLVLRQHSLKVLATCVNDFSPNIKAETVPERLQVDNLLGQTLFSHASARLGPQGECSLAFGQAFIEGATRLFQAILFQVCRNGFCLGKNAFRKELIVKQCPNNLPRKSNKEWPVLIWYFEDMQCATKSVFIFYKLYNCNLNQ